LKFYDDILYAEYESFSCGFDVNEGLAMCFCVQYESFSFDPIISDLILEKSKTEFLEYENCVLITIDFD